MKSMHRTATLVVLAIAVSATVLGDVREKPKPGFRRYVMVLKDEAKLKKAGKSALEPDIEKHGGKEHARDGRVRLVDLPEAAVQHLRREPSLWYLARVNTGQPDDRREYIEGPPDEGEGIGADAVTEPPTWNSGAYAYDGAGNIKNIGEDFYRYDRANRLVSARVTSTAVTYTYDSYGNRLSTRTAGASPIVTPIDQNTNRMEGGQYDVAGNETVGPNGIERFTYDAANMIIRRAPLNEAWSERHLYTADDERIATFGSERTWIIRDLDGKPLSRFQSIGGSDFTSEWNWHEDYYYANGKLVAGRGKYGSVGLRTDRHYHSDHLGTPRLVTDGHRDQAALHTYYPFGVEQTPVNMEWTQWGVHPGKLQFTGHERDFVTSTASDVHTYIDYMHARYYSPSWGRFLSVDPLLDVKRSAREPQSWNRYSYVVNNPINRIDPDGRMDGNGMGEPAEWRCPGCTRTEALEQSNDIAAGTAKGAAWTLGGMAVGTGVYAFATNATFRLSVLMNLTGIGIGMTGGAVAGSGQMHHIATNKNIAGGFTKQFEAIFAKAGMKLSDPANLMNLSGHAGRHSPGYHKHVLDTIQKATQGLSGKAYKDALTGALNTLRKELEANPDLVKMK